MKRPRICASITDPDITAIKKVEPEVDFFEVRLDLVGQGWPDLVKLLKKPWIACNRSQEEGGQGDPDEIKRLEELLWAAEAGACIVDIEYRMKNLANAVALIKARASCLISYHDLLGTPSYETLVGIVQGQVKAGADICKVVTTAQTHEDNWRILKLLPGFPEIRLVAFAMGESGRISRIISPLAGAYFTYACIKKGKEAASGQLSVEELAELYQYINR